LGIVLFVVGWVAGGVLEGRPARLAELVAWLAAARAGAAADVVGQPFDVAAVLDGERRAVRDDQGRRLGAGGHRPNGRSLSASRPFRISESPP
jgi:hypothetical protein